MQGSVIETSRVTDLLLLQLWTDVIRLCIGELSQK